MSYDIRLLIVKPGESVREVAYRDEAGDEPYTVDQRSRNTKIANAVLAVYPELDRFESDQHVELSDLKGGTGIQVLLFGSSGAISVPYWHQHNEGEDLERLNRILRITLENGPFTAFDPQTEQELTAERRISRAGEATYSSGVAATKRITKKPWWRFWQS